MGRKVLSGVRPTRIELQRLHKRLEIAQRGRDLLEDRLNAMLLEFFRRYVTFQARQELVDRMLAAAYRALEDSEMLEGSSGVRDGGYAVPEIPDLPMEEGSIMGTRIPVFSSPFPLPVPGFCPAGLPPSLALASSRFHGALADLLSLGEEEEALRALVREIVLTRRKVNAMDKILLPQLRDTGRYIEEYLEEQEREDLYRRKVTRLKVQKGA